MVICLERGANVLICGLSEPFVFLVILCLIIKLAAGRCGSFYVVGD